jgi:hypothetical protein
MIAIEIDRDPVMAAKNSYPVYVDERHIRPDERLP